MSKLTNPETEISVSCGFYNSLGDRKYDAVQLSSIFDGVIGDGIFEKIGDRLVVTAAGGMTVNVGTGKAWFNHTWTINDAKLPICCGCEDEHPDLLPHLTLDRIDAIVLEINADDSVRDNFIKIKKGNESSNPVRPKMTKENNVHQYPLCYIYRKAGSTEIKQSDITNAVNTSETPFVTGILQVTSLDDLLGQWQDQLDQFVAAEKADIEAFKASEEAGLNEFMTARKTEYDEWYAGMKQLMEDVTVELDVWTEAQKNTILDWFEHMKDQLSEDAAINLQIQIDKNEIRDILMNGFIDGTKTFSPNGSIITSVDSNNRTLTKTFTNAFLTCTTVLTDKYGVELGRMVKNFSADGSVIQATTTITDDDTIIRARIDGDNVKY